MPFFVSFFSFLYKVRVVYNFQLCTESRLKLERWIFRHAVGGGGWRQSPTLAGREAVPNSGGPVVTFDGLDRYEYPMSYWEPDCMHPAPTKNKPTNKKDGKRRRGRKRKKGKLGANPELCFSLCIHWLAVVLGTADAETGGSFC